MMRIISIIIIITFNNKMVLSSLQSFSNEVDYVVHRVNHYPLNKASKIKLRYQCLVIVWWTKLYTLRTR